MKFEVRGIPIELHASEALSDHIRSTRDFFEAEILDYLARNYKTHKTILDIGANIGNHSVYFAENLDYEQILCFEPIPENFALLRENMFRYDGIGVMQYAVSDATGPLYMQKEMSNMGASHIVEDDGILVSAVTIDKFVLQDVTLMKIDVEGFEPSVLSGASDTIFRCKPLILIEDWDEKYHEILEPWGYTKIKEWPEHHTDLWGPK